MNSDAPFIRNEQEKGFALYFATVPGQTGKIDLLRLIGAATPFLVLVPDKAAALRRDESHGIKVGTARLFRRYTKQFGKDVIDEFQLSVENDNQAPLLLVLTEGRIGLLFVQNSPELVENLFHAFPVRKSALARLPAHRSVLSLFCLLSSFLFISPYFNLRFPILHVCDDKGHYNVIARNLPITERESEVLDSSFNNMWLDERERVTETHGKIRLASVFGGASRC
ncbi:MAG: hypothetical protein MZV70_64695 [Desulfobacterales bacterium]|nr:hypothetical protein [Desulfobacterales bacterium]